MGPDGAFITGSDFLMEGGVAAVSNPVVPAIPANHLGMMPKTSNHNSTHTSTHTRQKREPSASYYSEM